MEQKQSGNFSMKESHKEKNEEIVNENLSNQPTKIDCHLIDYDG